MTDLRRDRAKGRDPTPGTALIRRESLRPDAGLTPGKPAFTDEEEGISEIVERRTQLLDGDEQLLRRHAAFTGLDSRDRLAILKAEQTRKIVLRKLTFLAQRLEFVFR